MSIFLIVLTPLYVLKLMADNNEPNSKHEVRNLEEDDNEDDEMPEL